jgi:hypothetical protein
MKRVSKRIAILVAVAGVGMSFSGGPQWMKLDAARAASVNTGLPIAVYATVNYKAEGC